jgi:hypothetical protein
MLLMPDWDQGRLEPVAHGAKAMDPRVASGAERNQKAPLMKTRTAVVDG